MADGGRASAEGTPAGERVSAIARPPGGGVSPGRSLLAAANPATRRLAAAPDAPTDEHADPQPPFRQLAVADTAKTH